MLPYVLIVIAQDAFELPKLHFVNGFYQKLLILGVVEERSRLPRGAELNQGLVIVRPDQIQDRVGTKGC